MTTPEQQAVWDREAELGASRTPDPDEAARPYTQRTTLPNGLLRSSCSECENTASQRDQGLGRATLAAWESRHGGNCTAHSDQES